MIISFTHSSSLRRLARVATARVHHLVRSAAALAAMSRLSPLILRSFSTVNRHLSLGCLLFPLPRSVHQRAVLLMELEGMRQTPPCLCFFCQSVNSCLIYLFFVDIVLGLYILRMRRRHLVLNTFIFRWIATVILQHSAPSRTKLNTLLLKILILVWTLRLAVRHTGFNMAKACLALLILVLISWSQSPVVVALVPK